MASPGSDLDICNREEPPLLNTILRAYSKSAARCGYHENYFIRLFTAEVGIPPQKYVTQTRIYPAVFLLHQNHSPSSIFSKEGFPNYSTFYRAFKRTTGFPPSRLAHELLFFHNKKTFNSAMLLVQ